MTFRSCLGQLPVTVFKSINDQQSDAFNKFKELIESITQSILCLLRTKKPYNLYFNLTLGISIGLCRIGKLSKSYFLNLSKVSVI